MLDLWLVVSFLNTNTKDTFNLETLCHLLANRLHHMVCHWTSYT